MKKKFLIILFSLCIAPLLAQDQGVQIMEKVSKQSEIHKTQKFKVYMQILDAKDRKRERYFDYTKKNY